MRLRYRDPDLPAWLIATILAAVAAAALPSATFAAAAPAPNAEAAIKAEAAIEEREEQAEETEEQAEEQAEAGEDAAAAPFALALAGAPSVHPHRVQGIKHQIAYLKGLMPPIRESIKFTRTLAHTTVRWQQHLPKKRQRLKELRLRIRELRVRQRELAHG